MSITISHSHADGTLVRGTRKGDGTNEILKSSGFRWFRTLGLWGIPSSRDQEPNMAKINAAADKLREAGHTVELDIDNTWRPTAQVEADKIARQQHRAEALDAKADRHLVAAAEAEAKHEKANAVLPPGGQPIMYDHYSAPKHERSIERARRTLEQSVAADAQAKETRRRAEVAARTTEHRYSPVQIANRINTLEAEQRKDQRELDGHTRTLYKNVQETFPPATGPYRDKLIERIKARADKIEYWKAERAKQIESGEVVDYGPGNIAVGDLVRYTNRWLTVRRVNAKSVSVQHPEIARLTHTVRYHEIRGHIRASDAAEGQQDTEQESSS